jgi:GT2 family glycosyltransferase
VERSYLGRRLIRARTLRRALGSNRNLIAFPDERGLPPSLCDSEIVELAERWTQDHTVLRELLRITERPLVSVLVPVFDPRVEDLRQAIASVISQTYADWQLCVADDCSTSGEVARFVRDLPARDPRIRVTRLSSRAGIARATNAALALATGDIVAMLDHDDVLFPEALADVALKFVRDPHIDVVYTDQCYIEQHGAFGEVFLKPDWSPILFAGVMYVGHLLALRRSLALEIGGFNPAFDNVQDFEFMLRASEGAQGIAHVPKVLYGWRRAPGSVATRGDAKPNIEALQAQAVSAHLARRGVPAAAVPHRRHAHRAVLVPEEQAVPRVAAIIAATADAAGLAATRASLQDLPVDLELAVVNDNPRGLAAAVRAASDSDAELVVFVESGVVIEPGAWPHLQLHAGLAAAGIVAPLLVVDGVVEEAGLLLTPVGVASAVPGSDPSSDGYGGSLSCAREVAAVSGAFAVATRTTVAALGGFRVGYATARYAVADLSLRALQAGRPNVVTPRAVARRMHRAPCAPELELDRRLFHQTWRERLLQGDPYHNPGFAVDNGGYRLQTNFVGAI